MLGRGPQGTNGVAEPGECCLWLGSGEVSRQHLLKVCFSWHVLQYPCTHCGLREFLIFSSCLLVCNRILGAPGEPLSRWQADEVLTVSLPGKFKISLCVGISAVSFFVSPCA